jgi:hypothetical protein
MTRWFALTLALLAGCGGAQPAAVRRADATCSPAVVHHSSYPRLGTGVGKMPWITGGPPEAGMIGVLAYWPPAWRHVREARIYTGGLAPQGWSMKVMWAFLSRSAKRHAGDSLVVRGRRMDGPGTFHDSFAAIGYEGQRGPSYASTIDVPEPGCWRLTLTTGNVTASVDLRAVRG